MTSTTDAGRSPARFSASLTGVSSVAITLFGLILVTFLIGRAMPIDPVLAIVGDHAPPDVVARVRAELALDQIGRASCRERV